MVLSIKWLGHASFQIKADGKVMYIDPYQGEYGEKAEIILSTHSHPDHCDPAKIEEARKSDTVVIAPADCVSKIGGAKTLRPEEKTTIKDITIQAVQAYNYKRLRSPENPFHPKGLGVGYLITIDGKSIYHAGDTDFIPEMKKLKKVHVALLPVGGTYTMDSPEAVEAALAINPKVVIPMHVLDTDLMIFKKQVEAKSDIYVVILKPGEEFRVE